MHYNGIAIIITIYLKGFESFDYAKLVVIYFQMCTRVTIFTVSRHKVYNNRQYSIAKMAAKLMLWHHWTVTLSTHAEVVSCLVAVVSCLAAVVSCLAGCSGQLFSSQSIVNLIHKFPVLFND